MALSDNYAPIKQLGNGSTTMFSGLWSPLSDDFIRVELVDKDDPTIIDPQVLNSDFTLTFDDDGFVVTFAVAPTSQYFVVIYRVIARGQNTPYKTVRGFQGQVVENSFDRAVGMIQEQDDELARTPKFAVTSTTSDIIIEEPVANSALVWNAAGDGLVNGPTITEIAAAEGYAEDASDSADAAAASAVSAAASAAKLTGTSTTSVAIATGSKAFTTQADKFFDVGTWLLITSDADEANYMHGQVTTYSGTSLTVNVTNTGGSGTLADWTIRVSGTQGSIGPSLGDGDKGDITVSASGATWTIDNDAVTYAKMQNVSAQNRILGRRSSGAGDVEENTISQILDMVGSAADGDILIRSSGSWTRLGIGSTGQGLVVSGGLPAWGSAGAMVLLQTQTASSTVTEIDFTTGFSSSYRSYIVFYRFIGNSAGSTVIRGSTDGGSTWSSTNYVSTLTTTSTSAQTNAAGVTSGVDLGTTANNRRMFGVAFIQPDGETTYGGPYVVAQSYETTSTVGSPTRIDVAGRGALTARTNALRFSQLGTGFLSGTTISLYGVL